MRRVACLVVVLCVAAGTPAGPRAQQATKAAARDHVPLAKQRTGVKWVTSFDRAMKMMGADKKPVILYFTYDT